MKKPAFHHFIAHYRTHKKALALAINTDGSTNIAIALGALDCLYWQALGNDLLALAKGINRTITYSYSFHKVRMATHPIKHKEAA